ncbi:MAG: VOC family protein, partial [Aigarchaeota archaeon]|nr:VOC family protein [Aigarchaeota archaeon]
MERRNAVMKKSSHIIRIAHIKIGVSDLAKSVHFYQDILGLEKIGEWPTYAVFDVAGVELGLEPKAKPGIFFLVDDVDKAYQDLKDRGARFVTEPRDQPWGGRTATLVDPDGNMMEIETFQCKVCSKTCQSYRELLGEHLKKHKDNPRGS